MAHVCSQQHISLCQNCLATEQLFDFYGSWLAPLAISLKPWEPVFDLCLCVCLKGGRISDKGVLTRRTTERLMERRAKSVRFIYIAEAEDKLNEKCVVNLDAVYPHSHRKAVVSLPRSFDAVIALSLAFALGGGLCTVVCVWHTRHEMENWPRLYFSTFRWTFSLVHVVQTQCCTVFTMTNDLAWLSQKAHKQPTPQTVSAGQFRVVFMHI